MVLLAPSLRALQSLLDVCFAHAEEYGMIFNPKKTVCMMFRPRSLAHPKVTNFRLGNRTLTFATELLYLGHHICDNLRDDADMARQLQKLNTIET